MQRHDGGAGRDEALSALIDGELGDDEAVRMLDRLEREPGLRAQWARYHAFRSTLEGAPPGRLGTAFAARVHDALEREPTVLAPQGPRHEAPSWLRPLAGVAIAASVALVAAGVLFALQRPAGDDAAPVASIRGGADRIAGGTPRAGDAAGAATPAALTVDGDAVASESARRRMGIYLANHSEFADAANLPPVVPYSRLTGFNAGQ